MKSALVLSWGSISLNKEPYERLRIYSTDDLVLNEIADFYDRFDSHIYGLVYEITWHPNDSVKEYKIVKFKDNLTLIEYLAQERGLV